MKTPNVGASARQRLPCPWQGHAVESVVRQAAVADHTLDLSEVVGRLGEFLEALPGSIRDRASCAIGNPAPLGPGMKSFRQLDEPEDARPCRFGP